MTLKWKRKWTGNKAKREVKCLMINEAEHVSIEFELH